MGGYEEALSFLDALGDPALYAHVAQTLVRGEGHVVACTQDGLIVHHRRGEVHMLAARTREAALALCGRIPAQAQNIELCGFDRETAESIRRRFGLRNTIEFVYYTYFGACPPPETAFAIRRLLPADVDFLCAHYAHAERDYIAQRVAEGTMLGALVDGELAGFIGEHVEGAMGLLYVLPAYRRRGAAMALERAAIRETMRRGHVPFNQVLPENAASHALQTRLGFTRAGGMGFWITNDEL